MWTKLMLGVSLVALIIIGCPAIAQADPAQLAKAVQEIENLDALRSDLAASLEGALAPPTAETMKQVCKPVGMKAQQLSQENNWQVKQIAKKYRNPAHQPDNLSAKMALTKFDQTPELMGFWDNEILNGQTGTRYYRRINVEASCLACHGRKANRPQFVKDNYPQDLAYNFNVGDLRGMYAVFIPDAVQQTETLAVDPSSADIRQLEEAPGQIVYQSRQTLRDQHNHSWQAIAFKRIRPDGGTFLYLRLVGFPGVTDIDRSQPLVLTDSLGKTLTANDASQQIFTDTASPAPNVGQYDLAPIVSELQAAIPLKLSLPTAQGEPVELSISPALVQEWQTLFTPEAT